MKKQPTGNDIVKLLGYSESSNEVLDLFDALGIDKSEIERDEDDDSFDIIIQEGDDDTEGTAISFDNSLPEKYRKTKNIGGQFLNYIEFDYNFTPLPYGLIDEDSLEIIEEKLGRKANYIDIDDADILHWIYEDFGWLTITFEENSNYTSVMMVQLNVYDNPEEKSEGFDDIDLAIKPYKR